MMLNIDAMAITHEQMKYLDYREALCRANTPQEAARIRRAWYPTESERLLDEIKSEQARIALQGVRVSAFDYI